MERSSFLFFTTKICKIVSAEHGNLEKGAGNCFPGCAPVGPFFLTSSGSLGETLSTTKTGFVVAGNSSLAEDRCSCGKLFRPTLTVSRHGLSRVPSRRSFSQSSGS